MNLTSLLQQNPWWKDSSEIVNDPKIKEYKVAKIKWVPRIKHHIKFDKDKIYTLRGPRQVGKTTLTKLLIKDLLDYTDSKSIFYYTCDNIVNEKELVEVIKQYLDWASAFNLGRKYLFLDEISSIKNWEKGLKYLADTGLLKNTSVILTGSHSIDIKHSIERLPGRRGGGNETLNKILLPMKFAEFAETVNPVIIRNLFEENFLFKSEKRRDIIFGLFDKKVDPALNILRIYQDELDRLFEQYLITGGIYRPINEFFSKNSIDNSTYEIYIHSLIGDLARWQVQERFAKQIIRTVCTKLTTNISWQSIAKETDIGSHNTVPKYIESLENSFVLSTLYNIDITKKIADYKKEKKIYFQDPFIFHALRTWVLGQTEYFNSTLSYLDDPENKSKLVESVIENHLLRLMYNAHPSDVFTPYEHIFYWKKKGGKIEVDFVFKSEKNELLPVELKYQNKIQRSDYKGLYSFKKGILISKNNYDVTGNYVTIPVSLFLLLI